MLEQDLLPEMKYYSFMPAGMGKELWLPLYVGAW